VVAKLEELKLRENTLLIFVATMAPADHQPLQGSGIKGGKEYAFIMCLAS